MARGRAWEEEPELRARGEAERTAYADAQRRFPLTRFKDVQVGQSRNYLVKGLIPRVGLVIVYGAPKCGKTFWVTDLMLHVALGREYRGRRVEQGAVVYIACEGERGLAGRIEAFRRRCLAPEDNTDPPFFFCRHGPTWWARSSCWCATLPARSKTSFPWRSSSIR